MTQPVHPTPEEEPTVEDDLPSNSPGNGDDTTLVDAEEPLLSPDSPLIFINSLPEENSVFVPAILCLTPPKAQASGRRFSREEVIVRGPPSCPLILFYFTIHISANL